MVCYASVSWTLQFIDNMFYVESYNDANTVNDDLYTPPAKRRHQEGV